MAEGRENIRGHRIGFECFAVLVACGIGTFVGLRGSVHDLDRSLARFYDETEFADLIVVGGETDVFAAAARDVPGVARVSIRARFDRSSAGTQGELTGLFGRVRN